MGIPRPRKCPAPKHARPGFRQTSGPAYAGDAEVLGVKLCVIVYCKPTYALLAWFQHWCAQNAITLSPIAEAIEGTPYIFQATGTLDDIERMVTDMIGDRKPIKDWELPTNARVTQTSSGSGELSTRHNREQRITPDAMKKTHGRIEGQSTSPVLREQIDTVQDERKRLNAHLKWAAEYQKNAN